MARKKRTSVIISSAEMRAAGIDSIDAQLDLGNKLTQPAFKARVKEGRDKLNAYNTLLADADELANELDQFEKDIADLSERMLKGVASRFGRSSNEYEKAGGTRKQDIRRSPRVVKQAA